MNRSEIMASTAIPMKSKNDEKLSSPGVPSTGIGAAEQAKDVACCLGEKAKDTASSVAQSAEDAAIYVGHKAEDAASYVGHKAEDATAAVGGSLKSLGSTIRENTPRSGMVGEASSAVADTLESTGRYLQEEGLKGITEDVANLIRRNPIPALLAGVGVGFLIARATTRRS
jgi:hypothetical protein